MSETLLKGEKVILRTKPHPLSFLWLYLYFLYFIIVNGYILLNWTDFEGYFQGLLGGISGGLAYGAILIVWWIITLLPAVIIAVLRISWRWLIFFFLVALISTLLFIYDYVSIENLFHITTGIAIIGILLIDIYRRSHEYLITNFRIVMTLGFLGSEERDVFYNKISDVFVRKGFFGKIFNFGDVIPITPSGIGTGDDSAKVTIGGGVAKGTPVGTIGGGVAISGEKSVKVARGRSSFILYGVPDPDNVKHIILENMKNSIEAYKLDRVIDLLEDIADSDKKSDKKKE